MARMPGSNGQDGTCKHIPLPKPCYSLFLFVIIFTVIATSVLVTKDNEVDDHNSAVTDAASRAMRLWGERIALGLSQEIGVARAMEGLAVGSVDTIPKHASPNISDRVQSVKNFDKYAQRLAEPWIMSIQLQPSGIVWQAFPTGSGPIGFDLLNSDRFSREIQEMIDSGTYKVTGPTSLVQGGIAMVVRLPIYLNLTRPSRANWWGNVAVLVSLTNFVKELDLDGNIDQPFTLTDNTGSTFIHNSTNWVAEYKTDSLSRAVVMQGGLTFRLFVHPERITLASTDIGTALVAAIFSAIAVTAVFNIVFIFVNHKPETVVHAPKVAPFFCVMVDIMWSRKLWKACPEEMIFITEQLDAIVSERARKAKCYKADPTARRVLCVTARSIDRAIAFAEATLRDATDIELADSVQAEIYTATLPVRISIHFCTKAKVSVESDGRQQKYVYNGHDVHFAEKFHGMCTAFAIQLTDEAKSTAAHFAQQRFVCEPVRTNASLAPTNVWRLLSKDFPGHFRSSVRDLDAFDNPAATGRSEMSRRGSDAQGAELVGTNNPLRGGDGGAGTPAPVAAQRRFMQSPMSSARTVGNSGLGNSISLEDNAPLPLSRNGTNTSNGGGITTTTSRSSSGTSAGPPVGAIVSLLQPSLVENPDSPRSGRHLSLAAVLANRGGILQSQSVSISGIQSPSAGGNGDGAALGGGDSAAIPAASGGTFAALAARIDARYATLRKIIGDAGEERLLDGEMAIVPSLFFDAYRLLFMGFRAVERNNVLQRLRISFGLPMVNTFEHLAMRTAIIFLEDAQEIDTDAEDQRSQISTHSHTAGSQASA